jgi:DNA-binding transcriptional regulator YiaG
VPHTSNRAEHFLEKSRLTYAISEFVNLHLPANPTYPTNPKTFGQELRKKPMDLGLQIKELAKLVHVTCDTIINWELGNVKPSGKNLRMVKKFLELEQTKG